MLAARRTDRLESIVADLREQGGRAIACQVDVTRREDLEHMVERAVAEFGRLDVLVNNAGVGKISAVADLDVDGWTAMIDVNVRGVLNGIAAAMPVFRRQGVGHLVTTVSTSGLKIVPTQSVYAGTKNAVRTIMEGLRQESTDGVLRTTSISPGFVRTEFTEPIDDQAVRDQLSKSMADFGISAESVARAIAFAIDQPHDVEIGDLTIRPTVQG
ncbi:SDR family oxidoreductase [Nocardia callitridis]|uniref:SDR family oxidoreductase n=1 Tax=Nocardia callitridis TaxID=648753 RepID=A0ABP9JVJ1_9NOCA